VQQRGFITAELGTWKVLAQIVLVITQLAKMQNQMLPNIPSSSLLFRLPESPMNNSLSVNVRYQH
jgi:hypothetical protein